MDNKHCEVVKHIQDILSAQELSLNHTLFRFTHKKGDHNFAVKLPVEDGRLPRILKSLVLKENSPKKYDYLKENNEDEYQYLQLSKIQDKFTQLMSLSTNASEFTACKTNPLCDLNLLLTEFNYNEDTFFIGTRQNTSRNIFNKNEVFVAEDDSTIPIYKAAKPRPKPFRTTSNLKPVSQHNFLTLRLDTDFILKKPTKSQDYREEHLYIFNRKNFDLIFNYDEEIKHSVLEKKEEIEGWKFLANTNYLTDQLEKQNVYKHLSKVVINDNYMHSIKNIDNTTLKRRLLEQTENEFKEEDFDGDLLVITSKNKNKILKMLSLGFSYNFFTGSAEG